MHWAAAGVSAPKTELQKWAGALLSARARPGNSPARAVPPRMPPIRRRNWRREVALARALVNASNLLGFIFVCSFHGERVGDPRVRLARAARRSQTQSEG